MMSDDCHETVECDMYLKVSSCKTWYHDLPVHINAIFAFVDAPRSILKSFELKSKN